MLPHGTPAPRLLHSRFTPQPAPVVRPRAARPFCRVTKTDPDSAPFGPPSAPPPPAPPSPRPARHLHRLTARRVRRLATVRSPPRPTGPSGPASNCFPETARGKTLRSTGDSGLVAIRVCQNLNPAPDASKSEMGAKIARHSSSRKSAHPPFYCHMEFSLQGCMLCALSSAPPSVPWAISPMGARCRGACQS